MCKAPADCSSCPISCMLRVSQSSVSLTAAAAAAVAPRMCAATSAAAGIRVPGQHLLQGALQGQLVHLQLDTCAHAKLARTSSARHEACQVSAKLWSAAWSERHSSARQLQHCPDVCTPCCCCLLPAIKLHVLLKASPQANSIAQGPRYFGARTSQLLSNVDDDLEQLLRIRRCLGLWLISMEAQADEAVAQRRSSAQLLVQCHGSGLRELRHLRQGCCHLGAHDSCAQAEGE